MDVESLSVAADVAWLLSQQTRTLIHARLLRFLKYAGPNRNWWCTYSLNQSCLVLTPQGRISGRSAFYRGLTPYRETFIHRIKSKELWNKRYMLHYILCHPWLKCICPGPYSHSRVLLTLCNHSAMLYCAWNYILFMSWNVYTFRPSYRVLSSASLETAFMTTSKPRPIHFLPGWTNGYNSNSQHPLGDRGLSAFLFHLGCSVYLSFFFLSCTSPTASPRYCSCKISSRGVFNHKVRARGLQGDWDPPGTQHKHCCRCSYIHCFHYLQRGRW